MPILRDASVDERARLLELFPLAVLKEAHAEVPGPKEVICTTLSRRLNPRQVSDFVRVHFARCKQHVYIFDRDDAPVQLPDVLSAEKVISNNAETLYIGRTVYDVLLTNPLAQSRIAFLWPILVQVREHHIVVRFVALEKDVKSYFEGRDCVVQGKSLDESTFLQGLRMIVATDIHRGIKTLWHEGFMDSPRVKYKKPRSTASEEMDEEVGIRANNPTLYAVLRESTLINVLFVIEEAQRTGITAFSTKCPDGYLAFSRYSDAQRNTDFVIDEILRRNR